MPSTNEKRRAAIDRLEALRKSWVEEAATPEWEARVRENVRASLVEAVAEIERPTDAPLTYMAYPKSRLEAKAVQEKRPDDDEVLPDAAGPASYQNHLLNNPGQGDIVVGDQVLYVDQYLGEEWTEMIIDNVDPIDVSGLGLSTKPAPHQIDGAAKLRLVCKGPFRGGLFADASGLGQYLTFILLVMHSGKTRGPHGAPALVITTPSRVDQWVSETQVHFKRGHKPRVLKLHNSTTASDILCGGYDFVVATYGAVLAQYRKLVAFKQYHEVARLEGIEAANELQKDKKMPPLPVLSLLSGVYEMTRRPFPFMMLDEVHHVKNHQSQTHMAIKHVLYVSVVAASATILHDDWHHLYGAIDLLRGHPFETKHEFLRVFAGQDGERTLVQKPNMRDRLIKFLMAVTVGCPASILDLPNATYTSVSVNLEPADQDRVIYWTAKFYESFGSCTMSDPWSNKQALAYATRAQQHAAHPALCQHAETTATEHEITEYTKAIREQVAVQTVSTNQTEGEGIESAVSMEQISNFLFDRQPTTLQTTDVNDDQEATEEANKSDSDSSSTTSPTLSNPQPATKRQTWLNRVHYMTDTTLLSPRIKAIVRIISDISTVCPFAGVIIFSKFPGFLDLVGEALTRANEDRIILRLDGSINNGQRVSGERDSALVILATPDAGQDFGAVEHVLRCETWWSAAEEQRVEARCCRGGGGLGVWVIGEGDSIIDVAVKKARDGDAAGDGGIAGALVRVGLPKIPRIERIGGDQRDLGREE